MSSLHGIGEMSPERFAELYMELGRREGVLTKPRYDEARFAIFDGAEVHELGPVYEQFLAMPAQARRYHLLRVLRGAGPAPSERHPWRPERLRPRLRSGAYLDLVQLDDVNRGRAKHGVHTHVVDELYATVVIDGDDAMTTVTQSMLDGWGRSADEVQALALDNLALGNMGKAAARLAALSRGFWMGPWDDAYAASRLLLLARDPSQVPGERPVLAVPNRDTLLCADAEDDDAITAMVRLMESLSDDGYPLSQHLFAFAAEGLVPFRLPGEHPAAIAHRNLATTARSQRYAEQQWLLQQALGEDAYVASSEIDRTRDDELVSRALWTEGVDTLLPEVDRVHLLSAMADGTSSRILVARFEDLCAIDGVLEKSDLLLPRWRTRRFPREEELEGIAVPVARDRGIALLKPT